MTRNYKSSKTFIVFVSLKKCQLTKKQGIDLEFIHRPLLATGVFDVATIEKYSGHSNYEKMTKIAKKFNYKELIDGKQISEGTLGELLQIGRKIYKKDTLHNNDLAILKNYYKNIIDNNNELTLAGIKVFSQLWDNYIYQIITQNNSFLKESIDQILMAIHIGFIQNLSSLDSQFANVLKSLDFKIVLPPNLFLENVQTAEVTKDVIINKKKWHFIVFHQFHLLKNHISYIESYILKHLRK